MLSRLFRRKQPDNPGQPTARLATWAEAYRSLPRLTRWRSGKVVGIVSLEGTIASGPSRRLPVPIPLPFIGQAIAGSDSIIQALRQAERDAKVAAVVFYVDSRGGAAVDSSLIWREVERLRHKKPVVVYMANAAASGGYYVAAAANWIVAQPLTVTGSIGVLMMKLVTMGLFERLRARMVHLERGARAGLFSATEPFDAAGRSAAQAMIDELYGQFKQVVIQGRKLEGAGIDDVAGGRVWLGAQALDRKLVDQLGDLTAAIDKARDLAKLPAGRWTPPAWISPGRGNLLPPPFPAQTWSHAAELLRTVAKTGAWMIAPYEVEIK
jgi:protease-4